MVGHIVLRVWFGVLLVLPAIGSAAGTDQEVFEAKVGKYGNTSSFVPNPKRLCVCIDDDNANDERMAGVLVPTLVAGGDGLGRVQVRCFVRRFNPDGGEAASEVCSSTWVLLR